MLKLLRGAFIATALATGLSAMLAIAVSTGSSAAASDQEIAQALRGGGLVIVLRHGATFPDQADTDPLNFDNIAAQRNLNDKGKTLAKQFGDALRQVGVPVGKVYTSKYNRGYETAVLAGFKNIEKTADLTEGTIGAPRRFACCWPHCRKRAPTPFSSRTIRTSSLRWARTGSTSKRARPRSFAPENGSYKLLARIQMDEWPRIAAAASAQR